MRTLFPIVVGIIFTISAAYSQEGQLTTQEIQKKFNVQTVDTPDGKIFKSQTVTREDGQESKLLFEKDLIVNIPGRDTQQYHVTYYSYVHMRVAEDGNCGPFSCNLSCSAQSTMGHMDRLLVIKATQSVIGSKTWGIGDAHEGYDKSCNAFDQDNMPGFRNRTLGTYDTWKPTIDDDLKEIASGHP